MKVLHTPRRSVKRSPDVHWSDGPGLDWHLRQMSQVTEKFELVGAYMIAHMRQHPLADDTDAYEQLRRDIDTHRAAMAESEGRRG